MKSIYDRSRLTEKLATGRIIDELEQQNARLREFVLAVKEMREAQLNAGATGYRNGAFNAAQREAEKKVNEILEAL